MRKKIIASQQQALLFKEPGGSSRSCGIEGRKEDQISNISYNNYITCVQLPTYSLTYPPHSTLISSKAVAVGFWDAFHNSAVFLRLPNLHTCLCLCEWVSESVSVQQHRHELEAHKAYHLSVHASSRL